MEFLGGLNITALHLRRASDVKGETPHLKIYIFNSKTHQAVESGDVNCNPFCKG